MEAIHLGGLASAILGVCCSQGDRGQRTVGAWIASVVMLVAMADTALGVTLVPAVVWFAVLLALAVVPAFALRRDVTARMSPAAAGMVAHRALSLLLMAGMTLLMAGHSPGHEHSGHHSMPLATLVVAGGAMLFAGFTLWLVLRLVRRRRRGSALAIVEVASMGAAVTIMAIAL